MSEYIIMTNLDAKIDEIFKKISGLKTALNTKFYIDIDKLKKNAIMIEEDEEGETYKIYLKNGIYLYINYNTAIKEIQTLKFYRVLIWDTCE